MLTEQGSKIHGLPLCTGNPSRFEN